MMLNFGEQYTFKKHCLFPKCCCVFQWEDGVAVPGSGGVRQRGSASDADQPPATVTHATLRARHDQTRGGGKPPDSHIPVSVHSFLEDLLILYLI